MHDLTCIVLIFFLEAYAMHHMSGETLVNFAADRTWHPIVDISDSELSRVPLPSSWDREDKPRTGCKLHFVLGQFLININSVSLKLHR